MSAENDKKLELPTQMKYNLKGNWDRNPNYRYFRLSPENFPGGQIKLDNTSQELKFRLPSSKVYNLSKCIFAYKLSIGAEANRTIWAHTDTCSLINSIKFGTSGDTNLANIRFANKFIKVARKMDINFNDYLTNDQNSLLAPSNLNVKENKPAHVNADADVNYLECNYTTHSAVNGLLSLDNAFPLDGIPKSVFSLDKDWAFNTDMYISIMTAPLNEMAWTTANTATPNDPTSFNPTDDVKNIVDASNATIKDVHLFIAVETNENIAKTIRDKVATETGYHAIIPYTDATTMASKKGDSDITINLTKAHGHRLLQVLTIPYVNKPNNLAYDCDNDQGRHIITYQTLIDSKQLQDYPLVCEDATADRLNNDDYYIANSKFCKNNALLNHKVYKTNWFHCDRFYEASIDDEEQDVGLPFITDSLMYNFRSTTNVDLTNYFYATYRRGFTISKYGVMPDTSVALPLVATS